MNLLKDLIKNFRYYCLTTTKKEIYIYLYHTDADSLGDSSSTAIEESYVNYRSDVDKSKSLIRTENENEVRLNSMNKEIIDYINNSNDITKISVINTSKNHKFILESGVFTAMAKKCNTLYFDMGTESGFRLTNYDYPQFEKIHIEESIIYLDKDAVLYVSDFYAKWAKLITFNKVDTALTLNLFIEKKFKALSFSHYASTKAVYVCKCKDGSEFDNAKFEMNYINFFGEETIAKDKNDERILIKGFNKVYFDNIETDDNVTYSTLIKADRITNFNLGKMTRNLGTIVPKPLIILGRVAKVNLRKMNIIATPTATINENDFAVISFLASDDDFERSITVTDSTIDNESDIKLKVLKLKKLSLTKVYLSGCIIGDNIDLLDLDSASNIVKLTYNNCTFNTNNDFKIYGSTKVSVVDCNITCSKNISLKSPYINVNGGIWNCDYMNCDYENTYMKILLDKLELHSNYLNIINTDNEVMQTVFINNCKLDVLKDIKISKLRPSFMNTYMKTEKFDVEVNDTTQFVDTIIGFQNNQKCNLNFKSNISGSLTIDDIEDSKINIDLYISDADNIDVNNLDLTLMNEKTHISYKTNRPINSIVDGLGSKTPIHFKAYSDIETSIDSYIKLVADDNGEYLGKVINDSEKIVEFSKSIDEEYRQVYDFRAISEDEE